MSFSFVNWLVHQHGQIVKTDERDVFQCPHPTFFQTKRGLTLEALKRKIHQRIRFQPLDQVCDISFLHPQLTREVRPQEISRSSWMKGDVSVENS